MLCPNTFHKLIGFRIYNAIKFLDVSILNYSLSLSRSHNHYFHKYSHLMQHAPFIVHLVQTHKIQYKMKCTLWLCINEMDGKLLFSMNGNTIHKIIINDSQIQSKHTKSTIFIRKHTFLTLSSTNILPFHPLTFTP